MTIAQDFVAQLARVLANPSQGQRGILTRAKDALAPGVPVTFLLRHPSLRDEAIVNSYGVDALVITMPHLPEFTTTPPEKFDVLTRAAGDALPYVFDAVVRREVGDVIVAWTGFVKGKGT